MESALGLSTLRRLYMSLPECGDPVEFINRVSTSFGSIIDVDPKDLDRIPKDGPLVVVANHPFGAIEGMALARLVHSIRPDVRVLANFLLGRIPELRNLFLLVDPFEGPGATHRSIAGLRVAHRWLERGERSGRLSGRKVFHLDLRQRAVVDPPWMPTSLAVGPQIAQYRRAGARCRAQPGSFPDRRADSPQSSNRTASPGAPGQPGLHPPNPFRQPDPVVGSGQIRRVTPMS